MSHRKQRSSSPDTRNRGKTRLRAVAVSATAASLIAAGGIALELPGAHAASHSASTGAPANTGTSGSSASSGASGSSSTSGSSGGGSTSNSGGGSSQNSSGLQSPSSAPGSGSGSGQVTTGGS
jgi:hypothetical protein